MESDHILTDNQIDDPGTMETDSDDISNTEYLLYDVRSALATGVDIDIFAIGGTIGTAAPEPGPNDPPCLKAPIIIRWDSDCVGRGYKITLPIAQDDAAQEAFAQLQADYEPPTFGIGDYESVSESDFNAREMNSSKFSTNFNPFEYGVISAVSQALTHSLWAENILGVGRTADMGITAQLLGLRIQSAPCRQFGFPFQRPQLENEMGTLIVWLPQAHQGGELVITHSQREARFDWTGGKLGDVHWAAYFSDCRYRTSPVTQGHRITLTYSLSWTLDTPTRMADRFDTLNPKSLYFYPALKALFDDDDAFRKGGILGFVCKHAYPHTSKSSLKNLHRTLKGLDMMMFQALKDLTDKAMVVVVLDDEHYRQPATERLETPDESDPGNRSESYVTISRFLHPVIHWGASPFDEESPDPHMIPQTVAEETAHPNQSLFDREKVTWLNHMPDEKDHTELAVTFPLTEEGSVRVGTYVSTLAILARVESANGCLYIDF